MFGLILLSVLDCLLDLDDPELGADEQVDFFGVPSLPEGDGNLQGLQACKAKQKTFTRLKFVV